MIFKPRFHKIVNWFTVNILTNGGQKYSFFDSIFEVGEKLSKGKEVI
jgi:hypothetical protein